MNLKQPFFSIIIPTLNEEAYLPKLLKDLDKQQFDSFEVLVVDGNSQDKTIVKAQQFLKKLNLSLYQNKSKGVSQQRNFGASRAKGQYLVFFDADVRLPKNFLSLLKKQIDKNGGYLFTTRLDVNTKSQTQLALTELSNFILEILNTLGKPFAPGFNITIEKELFNKLNGFDVTLKLAEDHDLVQRARKLGVLLKIFKSPVLYVSYRRPEKIGYLNFVTQYVISGLYTLTKGPIKKELYEYPMGGHVYKTTKGKKKSFREMIKNIEFPF
jgi:glycosyltransferase involved in cell wall biosynthesis